MRRNERPYQYIEPLGKEIKELQRLADKWQHDLEQCDDPLTRKRIKQLIAKIDGSKNKLAAKRKAIIQDLERIKKIDPEVYGYLYWHDVKRQSWDAAFYKTTPELMSTNPSRYAHMRVYRFLAKQEDMKTA